MKIIKYNIFVICFSALLSGCAVWPKTVDIPLIKEKNDLRIDAGVALIPAVNATVSYGLTDKIAVQTFGSIDVDGLHYLQGAVGLFKDRGNTFITEWYGGAGTGHANVFKGPGRLEGNYQLYFTQFNFGKLNAQFLNADYGFGLKTGYLRTHLKDQNYFGNYSTEENFDTYSYPIETDNCAAIEPTAFVRIGKGKLKFNVKMGGLLLYQFSNKDKKIPVGHFNAGIGLNYYINTKRKKAN